MRSILHALNMRMCMLWGRSKRYCKSNEKLIVVFSGDMIHVWLYTVMDYALIVIDSGESKTNSSGSL